jgi:endonuclease IV
MYPCWHDLHEFLDSGYLNEVGDCLKKAIPENIAIETLRHIQSFQELQLIIKEADMASELYAEWYHTYARNTELEIESILDRLRTRRCRRH